MRTQGEGQHTETWERLNRGRWGMEGVREWGRGLELGWGDGGGGGGVAERLASLQQRCSWCEREEESPFSGWAFMWRHPGGNERETYTEVRGCDETFTRKPFSFAPGFYRHTLKPSRGGLLVFKPEMPHSPVSPSRVWFSVTRGDKLHL